MRKIKSLHCTVKFTLNISNAEVTDKVAAGLKKMTEGPSFSMDCIDEDIAAASDWISSHATPDESCEYSQSVDYLEFHD